MRRMLILLAAVLSAACMQAQEPQYKMILTLKDGRRMAALCDDIDSMRLARLGQTRARLAERYATSTSVAVTIDADEGVSRVRAVCVPRGEVPADPRALIEAQDPVGSPAPCARAFDFLTPSTPYTVLAVAYNADGLPGEVERIDVATGKREDDPFAVELVRAGATTADYAVTPRDASISYYHILTGLDYYASWQQEDGAAGDVLQHFVSMWRTFASWYGDTWQSLMRDDLRQGRSEGSAQHLMWDAEQVIVAFGMTPEGELATPIQVEKVRTAAPTPSDNEIAVEVTECRWGEVAVKATTSNNDAYFVTVQPESYVSQFATSEELLVGLCYKADNLNPAAIARTADTDSENGLWTFTPRPKEDTQYTVIAVGLDEGAPSTKPVIKKITVPGGSF